MQRRVGALEKAADAPRLANAPLVLDQREAEMVVARDDRERIS